jgi:hypothetical protein
MQSLRARFSNATPAWFLALPGFCLGLPGRARDNLGGSAKLPGRGSDIRKTPRAHDPRSPKRTRIRPGSDPDPTRIRPRSQQKHGNCALGRDWGLGPGVVRTKPHPGSGRPARHARPGVAGNPARPGIGTGEGLGMPEWRREGLGGGGIDRYTYQLLVRSLFHVI